MFVFARIIICFYMFRRGALHEKSQEVTVLWLLGGYAIELLPGYSSMQSLYSKKLLSRVVSTLLFHLLLLLSSEDVLVLPFLA
jgi:hypothetical protein